MPKSFIAYTRVSTQKQSTHGVSLEEQRHAIAEYAARHGLTINAWYEEVTTAAKRGRPVFRSVMTALTAGKGKTGLIMHKIDRGARNLKDWADIGEAIDLGITFRFAHDDIDLHTRGGRLTADIQAVIAADYIRNLRDEVKKGIEGRLRQGIYPFKAPLGYLDRGGGKVKVPDLSVVPLIVYAFQLYASRKHSLREMGVQLAMRGLTQPNGQPLRTPYLSKMLRNPFYHGLLRVRDQTFPGIHQPLVSRELFERVQKILCERKPRKRFRHDFKYRRTLQCTGCERTLVGEMQKGRAYYRCKNCRGVCIREDRVLLPDPRFRILFTNQIIESPVLEPWEKFDYPSGIDTAMNRCSINGSVEP